MNSTPRKLAATSTSSGHLPVICILGTTGVGKSKLSVQLALNCIRQGEVINADTLQVYSASNLDLITNKLPVAEQLGVAHHLMSHVHPNSQYTVGQFVREAQEKIREIHARNKIPIIVGGTNYYIQSLLWNGSILVSDIDGRDSNPSKLETGGDDKTNYETSSSSAAAANSTTSTSSGVAAVANIDPLLNEKLVRLLKETESDCVAKLEPENRSRIINEMFELLETVDPVMAQKWHPNNDRRVRRSLEIFHQTGKRHSEWLKDQKLANDNNESATVSGHASPTNIIGNNDLDALKSNGGSVSALRYNTLFFWLFANQDVLDARLDRRVDSMLQQGLLEEIKDMREKCKRGEILGALVKPAGVPSTTITTTTTTTCAADDTAIVEFDYTRGLLQAIGFKEFHVYLSKLEQEGSGSISSSPSQLHSALFAAGVEEMKAATRRYARRQIQWIRNKLFGKIRNQMEQLEKQQLREVYNNTQAGIQIYTKNDTIANLCRRRLGFYVLDATSLDTWEDMVEKRGVQVSDEFISMCCEGSITSLPDPAVIAPLVYTQLESNLPPRQQNWKKRTCPICKIKPKTQQQRKEFSEQHKLHQLQSLDRKRRRHASSSSSDNREQSGDLMIVEAARLETTANNLENNHQQQQSISASSSSCSLPNRVFIGDVEWEDHLKSTQHKKNLKFVPGAAQLMQTLEQ